MSSYISPLPTGDDKATGAYAVGIAETAGGTNNNGHSTDSAGNVAVDFAWGNFPLQPNDVRNASVSNFGGEDGDTGWSATTMVASESLAYGNITKELNNGITFGVKPDSHELAESAYSSYPSYASGTGNYIVTAATGDGTTVTYTSMNWLKPGDVVSVTGCPNSAFNLSSQTVVTATRQWFTVTNSAGSGVTVTGFYGKVQDPNAVSNTDGAYIGGVDYVKVPNVVGLTTALASDALADAELGISVASAVTPSVTAISLTSNVVTLTTAASHGYAVGDSVVIAGFVNGGGSASADADINGTYTLTSGTTGSTLKFAKTHTDITSHSGITGVTAKVMAKAGTIKTQSVAAGANSITPGTTVTITPYFAS